MEDKKSCEIDYCPATSPEIIQRGNSEPLNLRLHFAVFITNLLSFSTGAAAAWSSAVIITLRGDNSPFGRPATVLEASWIASLIHLSATSGPLFASYLSEKFGRKNTLLLFAIPTSLSHLVIAFASTPVAFYIARFMMGLGLGCTFTVIPVYIGEIAETKNRGSLGCFMYVMVCSGMLTVYILGPLVNIMMLSFILMTPLALFLIIFGLFVPESPYYYIAQGETKAAERSLRKLRTNISIGEEIAGIKEVIEESRDTHTSSQILKSKSFRKGIIITTFLAVFQQLVGTSIILAYMELIFAATGSSMSSSTSPVIVALIQAIFIIVTSLLVDKWGRRLLLLISCASVAVALIPMAVFFHMKHAGDDVSFLWWLPVASLMSFVIAYCFGLGPLPSVLLAEIFSSKTKALASSITTLSCFVCAFLTTLLFPILETLIGFHGVFWLFSANAIFCFLFVLKYVPETKGKSFQDILKIMEQ